jgi:hypothetical protein
LVFVALIVSFMAWTGSQLGASLVGRDVARLYMPLVRHQADERHCYDNGTYLCEERQMAQYDKEFTIGYLPIKPLWDIKSVTLLACEKGKGETAYQHITTEASECDGARTHRLGTVFLTPDFESPTVLYSCRATDGTDTLLTSNAQECGTGKYTEGQKLGYVAAAGYLSESRLSELCEALRENCKTNPALTSCQEAKTICKF